CRPTCSARRPRREHVSFFSSCAEAERAGFRPCKRCHPNGVPEDAQREELIARACRTIEASEEILPLAELAARIGLSPHHLHRLFKQTTGLTPRQYACAHREQRLRAQLEGKAPTTAAIFNAGFNTSSRYYENADAILGMETRRYRAGGAGASICYAIAPCTLGNVLVAQSESGVCAILLGDDCAVLHADLRKRFPRALLREGGDGFESLISEVVRLIDAPGLGANLPLDIRGTAFQRRVWQALRAIPPGTTVTYTELARRLEAGTAVRAVASACAANPLAVAIPCHRVVRSDGALAGYRWGLERKRLLLDKEAAEAAKTVAPDDE
ncbi:MAG TPA: bifunctional DNA-binding transcriptional regulator/O6-methylguanine-DNA methyltransferase Ada, partial [Noviherbaspirillum sp.]